MHITIVTVGEVLVIAGSLLAGRIGGLGITALYGAAMAFFWMPPRFSLRVGQPGDIVELAFYGVAGLVLANLTPSSKRRGEASVYPAFCLSPLVRVGTELSHVIESLMSSDLGPQLQAIDFAYTREYLILPCTHAEALRVLVDVLTAAFQTRDVVRISVSAGRRPGILQLIVAAHYDRPAPSCVAITIGKADSECESIAFSNWPAHVSVTRFDNGYDRIFQVSMESEV